jgi:hypothetical protein
MKIFTRVIFILIGLVILAGITFFGFQFYWKLHAPVESPFKAIPQNSALVIKLNKPAHLWAETNRDNQLWRELFSIPYLTSLKEQISFLDSLIQKQPEMRNAVKGNPLFITLSPTVPNSYGVLFLINFPENDAGEIIEKFLTETWPAKPVIRETSYAGSAIYQVNFKNRKTPYYYTIRNGIFIGSSEELLVKQAIDRLSLNLTTSDDPFFLKVTANSGKNVNANIFINYDQIAPFIAGITTRGKLSNYLNVSGFAAWSGLDVIQKRDKWLINGYSLCSDTSYQYLSLFSGQFPQQFSMQSVLPEDAYSFTWIGLSDPRNYLRKLSQSKSGTSIYISAYPGLIMIESRNRINLSDYFLPWIGNEIGFLSTAYSDPSLPGKVYGIFKVSDKPLADSLLRTLGTLSGGRPQNQTYKGSVISNLNIFSLVPGIWGNLFQQLKGSFYTFLSDYVIFANDEESIKKLIDQVNAGELIDKSPEFVHFSENLSEPSNLCYYFSNRKAFTEIQSVLSEGIIREITPFADTLKKFESIGVQIIHNGEDYITNLFIPYDKAEQSTGPLVWQVPLDNPVSGKPVIIRGKNQESPVVLAYDVSGILYLIDWNGKISWKLKLPGQPLGEIREIYTKGGDSILFLFSTPGSICLVDRNGLYVNGSPFTLTNRASAGIACLPSGKPGEYVLYLQLSDKKIHAFDLNGKERKDWAKLALGDFSEKPVQVLSLRGKDYLFLTGRNGELLVTDKTGRQIIKPSAKSLFSAKSSFYLNKTNNKGDFLTSTNDGKLVYLRTDGKTSEVKFNNFTPGHIFYYVDINRDQIQEFMYFDLNKLYCYNRFQKLLFDYTFSSTVLEPVMTNYPSGEFILGTVSPKTGDIYLFGKKGMITLDPAVRGNTPFDLWKPDNETGVNLVIGSGNMIRNYLLPKE